MKIALILSGGTGLRMKMDIPKQYIKVNDKPIFMYTYETLAKHKEIDGIWVVADKTWRSAIDKWVKEARLFDKLRGFSNPGANRQLSIYNGIKDISEFAAPTDLVLIHDAARPLISEELISKCFNAMKNCDGVIPTIAMKDTVYLSRDGKKIGSLLNREQIYAGQAPEIFLLGKYLEANKALLPDKIYSINGSTEPAIMAGMNINMIIGDEQNFKITTQNDLQRFMGIIGGKN